jgi:peptide deformylase
MMRFMERRKGIGLAANQVGETDRLFVMNVKVPRRCFNPKILESSSVIAPSKEGCLSYPKMLQLKNRSRNIIVEYTNQEGNLIEAELFDLEAFVYQHELDHLNGIKWIS